MRVRSLLLTLVLSLLVGKSLGASFTLDGITYVANADTAIIKGYDAIPENGELTLASTVSYGGKDYRVTMVQNSAFLSCTELKKLVVPSTIKYIREGAFENCVNMTQLVLSEGEERLDAVGDAFKNCGIEEVSIGRNLKEGIFCNSESLVTVKLAKNVTTIPSYAFSGCKKLSAINLENVKRIETCAFSNCTMLKVIDIANIERIGQFAFNGIGVEKIELPETLVDLQIHSFDSCKSLEQVSIKSKISEIPSGSFYECSSLKSVDFPLSVRKICHNAFRSCGSLIHVSWGNVEMIEYNAFEDAGLEELTLPVSLQEIKYDAFKGCLNLKKVDLTKTNILVLDGFYKCKSLEQVLLPQKLQRIINWCFKDCSALEKIELPSTVDQISYSSFSGMSKLKEIDFSKTKVHVIPDYCFSNCMSLRKVIFNVATDSIGKGAFEGCSALSELLNCSNIKIVYADAFKDTKLFDGATDKGPVMVGSAMYKYNGTIEDKEYIVPSGVTCLCDGVFANQKFQIIKMNEGLLYIGDGVFTNCTSLLSLTIPNTVQYVGSSSDCRSLSILSLEPSTSTLFLAELAGSNVKKFYMRRQTNNVDWMPNLQMLFVGKDVNTLKSNLGNSVKVETLELEDTCSTLDLSSLNLLTIKSMHLGRPITYSTTLPNGYDMNCFRELQDLTIGDDVSVIPANFVSGNQYFKEIEIPSNIKVLEQYALNNCSNLTSLKLHEGLEYIKNTSLALRNVNYIDSLVIPSTVKEIDGFGCIGIKCKALILKEGVGKIGHQAFYGLDTYSLTLPSTAKLDFQSFEFSKIKYLDASRYKGLFKSSFASCENLEKVIMPKEGMTVLSENEFWACRGLKNIELPNTIDSISHSVFGGTQIHEVHIPPSVRTIAARMFCTTNGTTLPYKPTIYIEGCRDSAPIILNETFQDGYGLALGKLDVSKNFYYDFSDKWANAPSILNVDSLVIRNIEEFTVKSPLQSHFVPSTAICLSHYLTSCDRWKPTSGKVLVLPGSQLPKNETTEMYTVNKLSYEQPSEGDVLFDGVNNMPFEIKPVFYKDNQEVTLKEVGDYDLSMKISGTSFDGIYPTGLKVTVSTVSGIDNITVDEHKSNCPIYNLNGQRVDESYKGIVIQKGKKRIAK